MIHITNATKSIQIISLEDELYVGEPIETQLYSVESLKSQKIFGVYLRLLCEALPPGFLPYNYKAVKASGLKQFRYWE